MSKLTQSAKGKDCIRCGAPDAYACHYNGVRQHSFGKGRGIKCNDIATAELCYNCDATFSEGHMPENCTDKWQRSEEFAYYIIMTNIRRFNNGVIKVA